MPDSPAGFPSLRRGFLLWFGTLAISLIVIALPVAILWFWSGDRIFISQDPKPKRDQAPAWKTGQELEELVCDGPDENGGAWATFADVPAWEKKSLATGLEHVSAIVFRPDGKQIAVSGMKRIRGEVQYWSVATGEQVHRDVCDDAPVPEIVYSPRTRHYLKKVGFSTLLCEADSHQVIRRFPVVDGRGDFSPNGKLLAIPIHQQIQFFMLPDGSDARIAPLRGVGFGSVIKFLTSDYFLTHSGREYGNEKSETVVQRVSAFHFQPLSCLAARKVIDVRVSQDRTLVYHVPSFGIFGNSLLGGPFQLADWRKNVCVMRFNPRFGGRYCVVVTPEGKHVITGENNGRVTFWEIPSAKKTWSFEAIPKGVCYQMDITRSGHILAVSVWSESVRGEVRLFNLPRLRK